MSDEQTKPGQFFQAGSAEPIGYEAVGTPGELTAAQRYSIFGYHPGVRILADGREWAPVSELDAVCWSAFCQQWVAIAWCMLVGRD